MAGLSLDPQCSGCCHSPAAAFWKFNSCVFPTRQRPLMTARIVPIADLHTLAKDARVLVSAFQAMPGAQTPRQKRGPCLWCVGQRLSQPRRVNTAGPRVTAGNPQRIHESSRTFLHPGDEAFSGESFLSFQFVDSYRRNQFSRQRGSLIASETHLHKLA